MMLISTSLICESEVLMSLLQAILQETFFHQFWDKYIWLNRQSTIRICTNKFSVVD